MNIELCLSEVMDLWCSLIVKHKDFCGMLQLDDIKGEGEPGSMNVSAVALAAVDIAATVVEAALLNVQRTVAKSLQQPEVCMMPLRRVI